MLPLRPALHGAVGPWDEIIALIPVAIGAILLIYLYFTSRRGPAGDDDLPELPAAPEPPPPSPQENP
jgi:hypothetical protein